MVFRATQLVLERPVALRAIVPAGSGPDRYWRRFGRGAKPTWLPPNDLDDIIENV